MPFRKNWVHNPLFGANTLLPHSLEASYALNNPVKP